MTDMEKQAIKDALLKLDALDKDGQALVEQCRAINQSLAETTKLLAECLEQMKKSPVLRAQVSHNVPIIQG